MLLDMSYSFLTFLLALGLFLHSFTLFLIFSTIQLRHAETCDDLNQLKGQEAVLNTVVTAA